MSQVSLTSYTVSATGPVNGMCFAAVSQYSQASGIERPRVQELTLGPDMHLVHFQVGGAKCSFSFEVLILQK